MIMGDREKLIARIRQLRRVTTPAAKPSAAVADRADTARVNDLEARIAHLEQMVEGLQDSVYRESERQRKLLAELRAQIQPAAMSAALSKDARDRGL
jgi:uncharacterized coiled-coil protein SlyX